MQKSKLSACNYVLGEDVAMKAQVLYDTANGAVMTYEKAIQNSCYKLLKYAEKNLKKQFYTNLKPLAEAHGEKIDGWGLRK